MADNKKGSRSLERCTADHAGDDCNFSLRPCTSHPDVMNELVTLEDCPRKQFPTKRKSSGSDYAVAKERASATENTLQVVNGKLLDRVAVGPMAVDLFSEDDVLEVNEVEMRERIKAFLVGFPESLSLNCDQLNKSVDRILEQSRPETASAAGPGMVRVTDDHLSILICGYQKMIPSVDDLLGGPGRAFPPGWIENRRLELDQQVQQSNKNDDMDVLLAKIRVDLITKGYVEVPKDYMEPIKEGRKRDVEKTTAA